MSKRKLRIVAIETSARLGSVACGEDSEVLIEKEFIGEQRHTDQLLPTLAEVCSEAGWSPQSIDQVYVSAGPGSFTGMRVGITAAKALGLALDVKIVAVPSTDVMVLNASNTENGPATHDIARIVTIMDAKRGQVYAALYERWDSDQTYVPGFQTLWEPSLMTAQEVLTKVDRPLAVLGEGLRWHSAAFEGESEVVCLPEPLWQPRARNVLRCGWLRAQAGLFTPADQLTPIYVRRPEAVEKWEQRHGKES